MTSLCNTFLMKIYHALDKCFLKKVVRFFYPSDYMSASSLFLLRYAFVQKILGRNRHVPWPVHFTSSVVPWQNITKGNRCAPGMMQGCYIQATNGINFGDNVLIAPNVVIISANHDVDDYNEHSIARPIQIGDNVWIGANAVILPGVQIGSNVVIGAGSVVTNDIPSNVIAAGNPCKVLSDKQPYVGNTCN
jgi:acetyltransferase-like isoleucine patch superfamily enzyme